VCIVPRCRTLSKVIRIVRALTFLGPRFKILSNASVGGRITAYCLIFELFAALAGVSSPAPCASSSLSLRLQVRTRSDRPCYQKKAKDPRSNYAFFQILHGVLYRVTSLRGDKRGGKDGWRGLASVDLDYIAREGGHKYWVRSKKKYAPLIRLSNFSWLSDFPNPERNSQKRELSGPQPFRGVRVGGSKSTT
jgi:hypothetical protein